MEDPCPNAHGCMQPTSRTAALAHAEYVNRGRGRHRVLQEQAVREYGEPVAEEKDAQDGEDEACRLAGSKRRRRFNVGVDHRLGGVHVVPERRSVVYYRIV